MTRLRGSRYLGLDLDSGVVLAEAVVDRRGPRPGRAHAFSPPRAGEHPRSPDAYGPLLTEVVGDWKAEGLPVTIALPSPMVTVRPFDMPYVSHPRIRRRMVERQIHERMAFGEQAVVWDAFPVAGPSHRPGMVVVAAVADEVAAWADCCRRAGLKVRAAEPSPLAAWRWCRMALGSAPEAVLLVLLTPERAAVAGIRGTALLALTVAEYGPGGIGSDRAVDGVARALSFLRTQMTDTRAVRVVDLVGGGAGVGELLKGRPDLDVAMVPPPEGEGDETFSRAAVALGAALWPVEP